MNLREILGMNPPSTEDTALADLNRLSEIVDAGLKTSLRVGRALEEIRDRQLYRATHETFDAFVLARWQLSSRRAYQLIAAADVERNLHPGSHVLTEKAARHLSPLPPEDQAAAWTEATEGLEEGATVPAARVATAAKRRKPPTRKKSTRKPKPVRLRVAGAIVIVERRSDATSVEDALVFALTKVRGESEVLIGQKAA